MGMQFGKGRGLFLKLYLLWVSSQEMKNDGCTPLVNSLMRRTSAGKSWKEHSLREVSCQWGPLFPAFPEWFLSGTHPSAEVFCSIILLFSSRESEGAVLLPSAHPSPNTPPRLLSCLGQVKSLSFSIYLDLAGKHCGACQCTEDMYQHGRGWDPFGVPNRTPRIAGHILCRYFCNGDQKCFKRMLKSYK